MAGRRVLLPLATLFLLGGVASAHDSLSPLSVVLFVGKEIRVRLDYLVVDGARVEQLRERYDRDSDGRLSKKEQALLLDYLAGRAKNAFALQVGKKAASFVVDDVRPLAGHPVAVTTTLVADPHWRAGRHCVVVRVQVRQPGARTPVVVRAQAPASLTLAITKTEVTSKTPLSLCVDVTR